MSFREVNSLRREGRLDEAFKLAETDLQAEDSSWSEVPCFGCYVTILTAIYHKATWKIVTKPSYRCRKCFPEWMMKMVMLKEP